MKENQIKYDLNKRTIDLLFNEWADYQTEMNFKMINLEDEVRKLRIKLNAVDHFVHNAS